MYRGAQILPQSADLLENCRELSQLGANAVRWQLHAAVADPNWQEWDNATYWDWMAHEITRLKVNLPALRDMGLKVMVSLMTPIGGFDYTARGKKRHKIFSTPSLHTQFINLWATIIDELMEHPNIIGYTLLNEPHIYSGRKLKRFQKHWVSSLHHLLQENNRLYITCKFGAPQYFMQIPFMNDPDVGYTCNFYFPGAITHQGIPVIVNNEVVGMQHPLGPQYPSDKWSFEKLRHAMRKIIRFRKKHPMSQIWIGEYGCVRWSGTPDKPNAFWWMGDVLELFEQHEFHHTLHAWRECYAWSPEHGNKYTPNTCADEDRQITTNRLELLRDVWKGN